MLRSLNQLHGFSIAGIDEKLGCADEVFFDDDTWTAHYLVADTGDWLLGRKTLLAMPAVEQIDWLSRKIHVQLTREQIEKSPCLEEHRPISRQWQAELHEYYSWPTYWGSAATLGPESLSDWSLTAPTATLEGEENEQDAHLQSVRDLIGCRLETPDGEAGRIADFIADEYDWKIRYLAIDMHHWWNGKFVLLPTPLVDNIAWEEAQIVTSANANMIAAAPEYLVETPVHRDYEKLVYSHYNRAGYWEH